MNQDSQQYVTVETLRSFGITIDEATVNELLTHLNDTVEERIGSEIVESLPDEKLNELLDLQDNGAEDQVGEWIAAHVPDYAEIVQNNIDITVGELADNAGAINQTV